MSSAKITYNKRSIKMYLHKFLKTPAHIKILVPFILLVLKTQITKPHFTLDTKTFLRARLITRTYYFQMGYGGCNSGVQNQLDFIINVWFCKRFLPCPFTGPKKFWVGPNFLCQTKSLFKGCLSLFNYVPHVNESIFCQNNMFFFPSKTCFFNKKWTHYVRLMSIK